MGAAQTDASVRRVVPNVDQGVNAKDVLILAFN